MALKIPYFPAGLRLPASASSGAASYTEGTFSPSLSGVTLTPGTGSIVTSGSWTRIGRLVQVSVTFTLTGNAKVSGTAAAAVTNLPFSSTIPATGDTLLNASGVRIGECAATAGGTGLVLVAQPAATMDGSIAQDGQVDFAQTARPWAALRSFTASIWIRTN